MLKLFRKSEQLEEAKNRYIKALEALVKLANDSSAPAQVRIDAQEKIRELQEHHKREINGRLKDYFQE